MLEVIEAVIEAFNARINSSQTQFGKSYEEKKKCWMKKYVDANKILMFAFHLGCALPVRGSELLGLRVQNCFMERRNIFYYQE